MNSPVVAGETLTVEATVSNTGTTSGTQTVTLSTNGTQRDAKTVSVGAGSTETVQLSWNTTEADAGDYAAAVAVDDDLTQTAVTVQAADANLSVTTASLSSDTVAPNGAVNVTAVVENTGNTSGTETVTVSANGSMLAQQSVTVAAGANNTTEFEILHSMFDEPGTYEITVNGQSAGTLTVEDATTTEETDTGTPGFGVGVALVAVLLASLWARRE